MQYTTTNFADDVDEVREAMGFAQISLRRHEEHVRTVALRANRDIPMILARLARSPERCSTGTFLSALRLLLYYPRLVDELPSMLHDAARGMHFSVLCSEDVAATTDAEIARFIESATLVPAMHACTEALSIF